MTDRLRPLLPQCLALKGSRDGQEIYCISRQVTRSQKKNTSSRVYKFETLHHCKQVNYLDLCESECCPEQPVNPTSPAAHPSSVFCDDLLQHIKIWRVRFRFIPHWDKLSLLFLGLWPVVNSPLLSLCLNFGTETTRQHFFGN